MDRVTEKMKRLISTLSSEELVCLQAMMFTATAETLREAPADFRENFLERFVTESQPISDIMN